MQNGYVEVRQCKSCGEDFTHELGGRGRPPLRCFTCRQPVDQRTKALVRMWEAEVAGLVEAQTEKAQCPWCGSEFDRVVRRMGAPKVYCDTKGRGVCGREARQVGWNWGRPPSDWEARKETRSRALDREEETARARLDAARVKRGLPTAAEVLAEDVARQGETDVG